MPPSCVSVSVSVFVLAFLGAQGAVGRAPGGSSQKRSHGTRPRPRPRQAGSSVSTLGLRGVRPHARAPLSRPRSISGLLRTHAHAQGPGDVEGPPSRARVTARPGVQTGPGGDSESLLAFVGRVRVRCVRRLSHPLCPTRAVALLARRREGTCHCSSTVPVGCGVSGLTHIRAFARSHGPTDVVPRPYT